MTRAADLAKLIAGGGSITVSDNSENLKLITTDADASVGPTLRMDRQSASAADSDLLGKINFVGHNDAGTPEDIGYAGITAIISDASDGTEDGKLAINTMVAGTERSRILVDAGETVLNEDSVDVDFRVESNGRTHALFVASANNSVLCGDATVARTIFGDNAVLQVEGTDATASMSIFRNSNDNNGAQLTLGASRGTSTGSNTIVQDGDTIGRIGFVGADGSDAATPGALISAVVDGTPGSNDLPTRIAFFTTPDGSNSLSERMRINSGGKLMLGTTASTLARLNINYSHSASEVGIRLSPDATTATQIRFDNSGGVLTGSITTSGSGTAYNTSSDYRLKENVTTSWDATSRLKQLKPSRFNFKTDKDITLDGFIAHEVTDIVPEAVSGKKDAVDKDGNIDPQGIDQSKLVPILTKSLQEALARIDTLEAEVAKLKG